MAKVDTQVLADEFAAALEQHLDQVGAILEANGFHAASRVTALHAACEIFATFWPNAVAAHARIAAGSVRAVKS